MNKTEIQIWGEELSKEVHAKWEEYKTISAIQFLGYSVFYSPIRHNPKVLIVGFNPGGSENDFNPDTSFQIPTIHDYFNNEYSYRLALRMKDLFEKMGYSKTLEESVKTNLIFFRTKNKASWRSYPQEVRYHLENFCYEKLQEIIQTLNPSIVLFEGIETYNQYRNKSELTATDESLKNNTKILLRHFHDKSRTYIGILHPSGARIKKDEWGKIVLKLKELFT